MPLHLTPLGLLKIALGPDGPYGPIESNCAQQEYHSATPLGQRPGELYVFLDSQEMVVKA